jgi:ketosteroid isomerase-like protein
MHKQGRALLAVALSLLLGTAPLAFADEAADRAAVEAGAQAWINAFNARKVDALVALTTEDVVLLDPGVPPVSGRDAAHRAWQQALGAAQGKLTTSTKEITIAGDIAWRIGALAHRLADGEVIRGQSLEIWKRARGEWKLHRQMSSAVLAQPKPLTRPPSEPIYDQPRQ